MRIDLPPLALTLLFCGAIAATADETADELQRLEEAER